ncbi:hypothetical protein OIU76_007730 [Salix suchowensis]|nr:hypothetical protein OIU76_007730 [Salix suchowensis]
MTSSTTSFRSAAPVGYGFHPSDEELVNHFLRLKMRGGSDHVVSTIAEVNVCDFEPWELPGKSAIQSNDPECYFFSPRNYKYSKSQRANRTTKAGYWKGTAVVFLMGVKTNWIMHEYNPTFDFPNKRDFILYKLKKSPDDTPAFDGGESSTCIVTEEDVQLRTQLESFNGIDEGDYNLNFALNFTNGNM